MCVRSVDWLYSVLEREHVSLRQLSKISDIPYSTLKSYKSRKTELATDVIERICLSLNLPPQTFFNDPQSL